jgi:hypothetical protein
MIHELAVAHMPHDITCFIARCAIRIVHRLAYFSVTYNLTSFHCSVYRLTGGTRVKPNQEEAFLLWKREKDKLLKQKKLEQKTQKERIKSDNENKTVAEIVS